MQCEGGQDDGEQFISHHFTSWGWVHGATPWHDLTVPAAEASPVAGAAVVVAAGAAVVACAVVGSGAEVAWVVGVAAGTSWLLCDPSPALIAMSAHPLNVSWSPHPMQLSPVSASVPQLLPAL